MIKNCEKLKLNPSVMCTSKGDKEYSLCFLFETMATRKLETQEDYSQISYRFVAFVDLYQL